MTPTLNEVRDTSETYPNSPQSCLSFEETINCGAMSGLGSTGGDDSRRSRVGKAFLCVRALGLALIVCGLPSGCASFAEVTDLKGIQETPGFYPKALYYCGSDEACHFFEQETPLADMTPLSKHVRTIMVSRKEVKLPEGAEFPRATYTGGMDTRRQPMRIQITQRNPNRGMAEYARPE